MSLKNVGVVVMGTDSNAILTGIERAEELGIPAAWVPEGIGLDPLTLFAGAAGRTRRILLGSAIITTFARHPVSLVRQAQVIDHLAPGRLRLGVGPGHRDSQQSTYGADFHSPLGHLGEYLHIL
ncbi:MAG: LLM class flavin-dependent oxidoreductase [Dehalococcoidia bacterium]|nr:LLM class flavin-dependent oxidoreductase [Dehalococcoidia bacterium]